MTRDLTGRTVTLRRTVSLGNGNYADAGSRVEIIGHVDGWFDISGEYTDINGDEVPFSEIVMDSDLELSEFEDWD